LIDFTFNVGGGNLGKSILLQTINARNYKDAGDGFMGWLKGGKGIPSRRADEKRLWETGEYVANGTPIQ
jgi:lysozyme